MTFLRRFSFFFSSNRFLFVETLPFLTCFSFSNIAFSGVLVRTTASLYFCFLFGLRGADLGKGLFSSIGLTLIVAVGVVVGKMFNTEVES